MTVASMIRFVGKAKDLETFLAKMIENLKLEKLKKEQEKENG